MQVIIAQGADAGGHGNREGAGMVVLVEEVVDRVGGRAVVVAAGGVGDGRGVAAGLCAGAGGGVLGTRLGVTVESEADVGWKGVCSGTRDGGVKTVR